MTTWMLTHPLMTPERLGLIPSFLDDDDPRPAWEQINERYAHGGGWRPTKGFTLLGDTMTLQYVDEEGPEEPISPLAICWFHDELLCFYDCDWLAIFQRDETFEVSRLD